MSLKCLITVTTTFRWAHLQYYSIPCNQLPVINRIWLKYYRYQSGMELDLIDRTGDKIQNYRRLSAKTKTKNVDFGEGFMTKKYKIT